LKLPNLNPQQAEAVAHGEGPCVVLAGPGAGKTAALTRRAARLVQSGVPPERVLLLTFTRNSAREMLERAKTIEPACEMISGGTFHSLATRVINRNAQVFGVDKFTILDPDDCKQIIKKVMDPMRAGEENWPTPAAVSKVISLSTNTCSTVEEAVLRVASKHAHLAHEFQEVRDAYVSYKLERNLLDYDDCLEYFATLLEDPDLGPQIREQWEYCLFDEYQDTNALQLKIVYGLAGPKRNVTVVGDAAQAIYSFRGAAPATMKNFFTQFPDAKLIKLETNYRSSAEIVDLVNAADRITNSGFQRTLVSASGRSGIRPVLLESPDESVQASEIAKSILAHKADGGEVGDCAILVRSMSFARRIELELTTRKIPYKVTGGLRIDEAAHVKDLLCLARVATNHQHEPAWLRILARHRRIADVAAAQITDRISIVGSPDQIPGILESEAETRKTSFEGLPDALRALMVPGRAPVSALSDAVAGMEPFWSQIKEWKDDWEDRRRDIDAILHVAAEHRDLDAFLTAITLDYSVDSKKRRDSQRDDEKPVTISTIHGAKGLEWPIVHIPSFIAGHMPSAWAGDPEEEARILYVALSRAQRELVIHKPMFGGPRNEYTTPSEYERLVRPFCLVERASQPASGGMAAASGKRIDMRAKLLGK
jgi:DNA helicase-2/ATP-dependent DNA helicase PcrA